MFNLLLGNTVIKVGATISIEAQLDILQSSLKARFDGRRAIGEGQLGYIFEHGLSPGDLAELFSTVRQGLLSHRIDSGWWTVRELPLLAAATEIGYFYEGTGTDFWPKFAQRLGDAGHVDRQALSRLFERASTLHGLAVPADTAWNRAFCHVAWPITHAIMPRELHRPYARCLSEIRVRLDLDGEDGELLAPIRQHARFHAGSRLLAWLETPRAAAAITRHFLGKPGATTLDPVALARISADLAKDQAATSALSSARRRQKALEAVPPRRGRGRATEPELRNATLVMRRSDQHWSLAIKLPQMEDGLRATTREALDALRWRALFWGQGRPVAARSLFSDHPIPISCIELPPPSAPILADLTDLPIALDAQLFLGSFRIQSGLPLLFADADSTGDYHQLLTAAATIDRRYALLAADSAPSPPHAVQRLGRVAGCQVLAIDTADEESRIWLARLGIVVREYASFAWLGAPEIEQHRPVRRFCVGDPLVFETRRSSGLSNKVTIVDPDKIETTVTGDDHLIAAFTPTTHGRHSIDYGGDELMAFDVVDTPEPEMLLSMRLEASLGSIGELVSKSVALRFESSWSVQEVDLELRIASHGRTLARTTTILPDTPCRIPADHAIWSDLLDAEAITRILEVDSATLEVHVGCLLSERFEFERATAPFEWFRDGQGRLRARDEAGDLQLFRALASSPLASTPAGDEQAGEDIVLVRAGQDEPVILGSLCIGPKIWKTVAAAPRPTHLPRRLGSSRDGSPGALAVIDALVAWSSADVDHPVTQYRRGQIVTMLSAWSVEQLCGKTWSERERTLAAHRPRQFGEAFLDACTSQRTGFAPLNLPPRQQSHLRRILLRQFDRRLADLPPSIGREPINKDGAALLDELFNDAYTRLARDLQEAGEPYFFDPNLDVDVGETSEVWDSVLREARRFSTFDDLLGLLRPLVASDELGLADFEAMAPDEVVDLLGPWITRNRPQHLGRTWSSELVEAAFWLFAKPAVASRLAWRASAERMLADSFSARAIRYAALRSSGTQRVAA